MASEPTYRGYPVTAVTLIAPDVRHDITAVVAEARHQRDGSRQWVVTRLGWTLTRDGDWEYEPLPSSRDDAYVARTRWPTLDAAIDAYEAWACGQVGTARKESE